MYLIQKVVRDIAKEVAEELNLPLPVVMDICTSQFSYVASEMMKGTRGNPDSFSTIQLRYLGTFAASHGKINHMSNNANKFNKDNDGEEILHTND